MKHAHSHQFLPTLLAHCMEDALSHLQPWQENETSRQAETVLASLPNEQSTILRRYLNELAGQETDEKQILYLQGILDGLTLSGLVHQEEQIAHQQLPLQTPLCMLSQTDTLK